MRAGAALGERRSAVGLSWPCLAGPGRPLVGRGGAGGRGRRLGMEGSGVGTGAAPAAEEGEGVRKGGARRPGKEAGLGQSGAGCRGRRWVWRGGAGFRRRSRGGRDRPWSTLCREQEVREGGVRSQDFFRVGWCVWFSRGRVRT
jgi:hypothetical protein